MEKLLIVNNGSASKKYALFSAGVPVFKAHLEKDDEGEGLVSTLTYGSQEEKRATSQDDYENAVAFIFKFLVEKNLITGPQGLTGVGLRVVAPGEHFKNNHPLDAACLAKLEEAKLQAPLHITPVIAEIRQLKKLLPDTPVIIVSDSAFHANMPDSARRYSLPKETAEKFEIYRWGYHGISMSSVLRKFKEQMTLPGKIIICHLGSGSTITAVKDGKSFDTSMGFTPLEGLVMGTRVGTIDAGAVLYLLEKSGMKPLELEDFFNKKCGLLGLSGKTNDVRELIALEREGDEGAKLALDSFATQVKKYIGAYSAEMGGLDVLIFTATIGERSWIMRERICAGLESMGIVLDEKRNKETVSKSGFINQEISKVRIAVTPTDEMGEIAQETSLAINS